MRHFLIVVSIALAVARTGLAEQHESLTWTDVTGKHKVEAKFVKVEDEQVVLRKPDGKQIRVPLAKLDSASRTAAEALEQTRIDTVAIERVARQFLVLLRQTDREGAEELITAASRSLWESGQSPIKQIPNVDRGSKPRVRGVEIQENASEATAKASLKYNGKLYPATLHFRKEDDQWLLCAATGQDEEGAELHYDFEQTGTGGRTQDARVAAASDFDSRAHEAPPGNVTDKAMEEVEPSGAAAATSAARERLGVPVRDADPRQVPPGLEGRAEPPGVESAGLLEARAGFTTTLVGNDAYVADGPAPEPPDDLFELIKYPSPAGDLSAYLTPDPRDEQRHPAVVWAHGGFGGIGAGFWEEAPAENDQSARAFREAGFILMCPSWRGENDNPGEFELFFGEVNDVIAAGEYVKALPYVDPDRVYLAGHSTGGTIVLLAAESTDLFRAVFSFGGAPDMASVMQDGKGYGNTPYDLRNGEENRLRSPIEFVKAIRSPTFYFEGANQSFYPRDARRMQQLAAEAGVPLSVHILDRGSHFDILAPLTKLVTQKITADTGPECSIDFTDTEINTAFEQTYPHHK